MPMPMPMPMPTVRAVQRCIGACVVAIAFVACSDSSSSRPQPAETASPASAPLHAADGSIVIGVNDKGRPFDRRLLGTNLPAWIGPKRLADPAFARHVRNLGTSMIRMPGGSWSSVYNWLPCEDGTDGGCPATGAATPSDFLGLLDSTMLDGMWTVDFNGTAQEAAALVAFFNGSTSDTREIGPDRHGKDWGTVGRWATLRLQHGHPDPHPVRYWEIGNEVYGAKESSAPECASFGWEEVWTCDGAKYVNGNDSHDGYLAFRTAMKAVDPTIQVGAVGIGGYQSQWDGFGYEVIQGTGDALDFYVIHDYGFDSRPSTAALLSRPETSWRDTMRNVREALDAQNPTRIVPIFATEYNLFAFYDADTTALMSKSINALYIADTIGQMATNGVTGANQWNLVNGENAAGSDYGILDAVTDMAKPQFYALALWSRFGETLLPAAVGFDESTTLSAYAGGSKDGSLTIIAINKTAAPASATIDLQGAVAHYKAVADVASTPSFDSTSINYNGSVTTDTDLSKSSGTTIPITTSTAFPYSFAPMSITLITLTPATTTAPASTGAGA
jgi:hypothetical protein